MPQEVANKRYEKTDTAPQTEPQDRQSEKKNQVKRKDITTRGQQNPEQQQRAKKKINTYTFRLPSFSFCSLLK